MHGPRRFLGVLTLFISFLIVPFMGTDPTISNIQNNAIVGASWWVYAAFLAINYLLLFYIEIDPPSPDDSFRSGSNKLKDMYREMRTSS